MKKVLKFTYDNGYGYQYDITIEGTIEGETLIVEEVTGCDEVSDHTHQCILEKACDESGCLYVKLASLRG